MFFMIYAVFYVFDRFSDHFFHIFSVWNHDNRTAIIPSDRLTNFYRKFNRILLDNLAIQKERERLALENAQLQDLIAQYVSGTQIGEDTLSGDNPLFVVNGRCVVCVCFCFSM